MTGNIAHGKLNQQELTSMELKNLKEIKFF